LKTGGFLANVFLMTSPRTLLKAWKIKPKKQWGQNFLIDPSTAEMIISRAQLSARDVVLEIGAGLGALTIPVARVVKQVLAVERDRQLSQLLKTELLANQISNVTILREDILKVDIEELTTQIDRKFMVVGNLPYNISSQVLLMLIHNRNAISRGVFMFQKELAQRLTAEPGNKAYGRITVMLKYCSDVRTIATVKAAQFFPPPKVDSQVLEIKLKARGVYSNPEDEKMLFRVIKAAFGNRRKTLKNSLTASGLQLGPQEALKALIRADIDPARRAETLAVKEFIALTQSLRAVMREAD